MQAKHRNIILLGLYRENQNEEDSYSISGYHQDSKTNLVILQKDYLGNTSDQAWNFLSSGNFESDIDIDIDLKVIEGYNYKKMVNHINEQNELQLNNSFIEIFEMESKFTQTIHLFFDYLFRIMDECKPDISPINNEAHYPNKKALMDYYKQLRHLSDKELAEVKEKALITNDGKLPIYGGHLRENYLDEMVRTKDMLGRYLKLSDKEVASLKKSHSAFLNKMMNDWPDDLLIQNKFNDFMKGDGIVYLAGGKYNQLVFLSIKILRSNGSRLPVEVIIPKAADYDIQFCERILPTLNGKCKLMTDYLPRYFNNKIEGFQLKNIALLISSFERVLYLDADNLPIRNPDVLFNNKPFTDKHLVLWPDFWRRSTSPTYYEIADIPIDPNFMVRNSYIKGDPRGAPTDPSHYSLHDTKNSIPEASSETGQLLINKRHHFRTLVLAMYYNYFGPDYFYPLFSQGAAGEGDKETFIAAAHRLDLPYYQVNEFNREFGPMNAKSKKRELFAMGQYDPIIDYIQSNDEPDPVAEEDLKKKNKNSQQEHLHKSDYYSELPSKYARHAFDDTCDNYDFHLFKSSSLFFLHANWPKYYLNELFVQKDDRSKLVINDGPRTTRLYGNDLLKELNGYDFELTIFKSLKWCYCEEPLIDLMNVPLSGTDDRKKACHEIERHLQFLESSNVKA
ncbi:uncharacterized protein J8A68_002705 [[Candida] subhashii]|uniref:Uncharacterized protein n=1 Tax=[Candida] subhashii TaxID=561895 RepID=A0A8J5QNY1_9ASCO|nr:uncharacterized protein J8A68_002705 [[Candida] subhashii]KAG7663758.1 hypothetical protein J8A68_002705 [[Candida] subhashii]